MQKTARWSMPGAAQRSAWPVPGDTGAAVMGGYLCGHGNTDAEAGGTDNDGGEEARPGAGRQAAPPVNDRRHDCLHLHHLHMCTTAVLHRRVGGRLHDRRTDARTNGRQLRLMLQTDSDRSAHAPLLGSSRCLAATWFPSRADCRNINHVPRRLSQRQSRLAPTVAIASRADCRKANYDGRACTQNNLSMQYYAS